MGGNKGKRRYTRAEIREKVNLMIEECWDAVAVGAGGMEFTVQAKGRLRGFRGFRRPFYALTEMDFGAYERRRDWLLLQSMRLGRYARDHARHGKSAKITRKQALAAVDALRRSACTPPSGLPKSPRSAELLGTVKAMGNWCDFAPIDGHDRGKNDE